MLCKGMGRSWAPVWRSLLTWALRWMYRRGGASTGREGENESYIFAAGNARPLDQATQHATTEMIRWLEKGPGDRCGGRAYSDGARRWNTILGNIYDPAYTMVCKMPKAVLAVGRGESEEERGERREWGLGRQSRNYINSAGRHGDQVVHAANRYGLIADACFAPVVYACTLKWRRGLPHSYKYCPS